MDSKKTSALIKTAFFSLLLISLGLGLYKNSLPGEFLWDDHYFIVNNFLIRDLTQFPKFFAQEIAGSTAGHYGYYRPLPELSYALDFSLWRLDPAGYHLTNIFLHIAAGAALFLFSNILIGNFWAAASAAILFVCHPVQTEAVSYISGRGDLLAVTFLLLGLTAYLKFLDKTTLRGGIGIFIFFTTALFSKENALTLPLLLWAYHFSFRKTSCWAAAVPGILSIGFYSLIRLINWDTAALVTSSASGIGQRLPGFFQSIPIYLRILFSPGDLHFDYGQPRFAWNDWGVLLGVATVLFLLLLAAEKRKSQPLWTFAILWFFIGILPAGNIYRVYSYIAEHSLYLAGIGFFILLGQSVNIWTKDKKRRPLGIALLILLTVLYGFQTVRQNFYWQDPLIFYDRALQYTQRYTLYINLGTEYQLRDNYSEAIIAYKKALALNPGSVQARKNLAAVYLANGHLTEAENCLWLAAAVKPNDANIADIFGRIYQKQADTRRAEIAFKKALRLDQKYSPAYRHLAELYLARGQYHRAMLFLQDAVQVEPNDPRTHFIMAQVYHRQKEYAAAADCLKKSLNLDPDYEDAKQLAEQLREKEKR